jgi:hypothetical protein
MHPMYGFGPGHSLIYLMFFGFFGILFSIVMLIPYWFIFKKAGFSPFLALLMFLPLINIAVLYFLAFALECGSRGDGLSWPAAGSVSTTSVKQICCE